jgi:hypothetical protein
MDSAVRFAVTVSPRQIAGIRAALRHAQDETSGLADAARVELDGESFLSDDEIDELVNVLRVADEVTVLTSEAAVLTLATERRVFADRSRPVLPFDGTT